MSDLTEEQKRVKIAEACGWTDILSAQDEADTERISLVGLKNPRSCLHERIPDYFHDLNACHEAEKVLTGEQCDTYWLALSESEPTEHANESDGWAFHAPANVRAEHFGKTLNLW